ncbi:hypothetical protein CDLVIII_3135 [Clostridium sp. DL-VIII]|uniref:hypothetical protein n=1 Tax=Clostridium sp. DL-VIII TaxID=641107 RepID=UPI00023AFF23|nr:hypothetical protein [Clostridium sp. DL-VIII]EHI99715.1 hypothetical protein CDLVIII_3135 [Clostridium sp. DL-VIII]
MDKGIIKMVIIVTIIAITLLVGSLCIAMRYGGLMMRSMNTSNQTNQDGGTGMSYSSNPGNQKSISPNK